MEQILTHLTTEINVKDIKLTEEVKCRRQDYTLYEFPVLIRKLVIGLEKGLPVKETPGSSGEGVPVLLIMVAAEHLYAWIWDFSFVCNSYSGKRKGLPLPSKGSLKWTESWQIDWRRPCVNVCRGKKKITALRAIHRVCGSPQAR